MGTTVDDIKSRYSMRDVLSMYGLAPNHAGFIICPFHNEDSASCKIYKDSFYCFGCHVGGDIFEFVERIEHCDFKTAFKKLGGDYGKGLSDAAIMRIKRRELEQSRKDRTLKNAQSNYLHACNELSKQRELISSLEPMSDAWCEASNNLVKIEAAADEALARLLDIQKTERG